VAAVFLMALVGGGALALSLGPPSAPEQPIGFSHKLHAGDNRIACVHFRVHARPPAVAGTASVRRCVGYQR
jgi:hypothetical protein